MYLYLLLLIAPTPYPFGFGVIDLISIEFLASEKFTTLFSDHSPILECMGSGGLCFSCTTS